MEKYTVHFINYESENFYCVYENASQMVYDFFMFSDDAHACKKKLETGIGFDGFTPEFMLRKVKAKDDINTKFQEL